MNASRPERANSLDAPCAPSRARSPRRSAGACGPSRPPRPRRSASSARRSRSSSRLSTIAQQVLGLDAVVAALGAAHVQGADAALVVGGHRHRLEHARDLVVGEAVGARAARASARSPAPGRTGRRSCPGPRRRSAGACRARTPPPSRTACRSPASASPTRAPPCARGSAPRSSPRRAAPPWRSRTRSAMWEASVSALKASPQHHLVDGLVHHLLEARHVRALLLRAEVHEALELARRRAARRRWRGCG